jgi:hypothetical protein
VIEVAVARIAEGAPQEALMNCTRAARAAASITCLAALLLLVGCSTTIGTNPEAYPFPSHEVFELRPGVSVALSNGYPAEARVELASRVYCDLRHFTETATAMVHRELAKAGASVGAVGPATVVLRMTHPSWIRGSWTMKGRVTLEAQLGNGQKLSYDGESQTGGNAMRAFNGAILRAVTAFLKDPAVAAYLNAAEAPAS